MANPRRFRIYAAVAALCVGGVVAYVAAQYQWTTVPAGAGEEPGPEERRPGISPGAGVAMEGVREKARAPVYGAGSPDPFPALPATRSGLPLEGDPFGPASVEEQRWLDRNGYPTAERWFAYSTASEAVLEQAVSAGDEAARVILGIRRLEKGDPGARDDLLAAAVGGSGFALDAYASFLAGSGSQGDPAAAYVLSRVAEMRGDHRQAVFREFFLKKQPTQQQRLDWGAEALALYSSMHSLHKELYGESSSWTDPRPVGD